MWTVSDSLSWSEYKRTNAVTIHHAPEPEVFTSSKDSASDTAPAVVCCHLWAFVWFLQVPYSSWTIHMRSRAQRATSLQPFGDLTVTWICSLPRMKYFYWLTLFIYLSCLVERCLFRSVPWAILRMKYLTLEAKDPIGGCPNHHTCLFQLHIGEPRRWRRGRAGETKERTQFRKRRDLEGRKVAYPKKKKVGRRPYFLWTRRSLGSNYTSVDPGSSQMVTRLLWEGKSGLSQRGQFRVLRSMEDVL